MADQRYWFARHRLNPTGRGLVPVAWQGWAVIGGFVGAMLLGGLCLLGFGLRDQFFAGIACFVLLAAAGAITFVWAGATKADPVRTVADYKASGELK